MQTKDFDQILEVLMRETGIILAGRTAGISPDSPLPSLGFDSMSFVELLVSIERNFDVKLIDKGMGQEDLKTLRTLALCLQRAI